MRCLGVSLAFDEEGLLVTTEDMTTSRRSPPFRSPAKLESTSELKLKGNRIVKAATVRRSYGCLLSISLWPNVELELDLQGWNWFVLDAD